MMKHKFLPLLVALTVTTSLWASNVITYTAPSKLNETTSTGSNGLYTNAFNVAISSHTFANDTGTITFAGELTTIGNYAFRSCSGLTSVTIPNSVTTIGNYAFYNCSGLTSVTIPNSVTTIGNDAFSNCSTLTSVTIPNSVTTIGNYAFYDCSGLTSVTIPNSVTTIGYYAFSNCHGLKKTNYTGTVAEWCKIKFVDDFSNPISYSHNFFINDVEITDLVIPNSVDTIGNYAFYDCRGLTSVTIGNSVTTIGLYAFYDCSGLTSVTIPNSVTTIDNYAFYDCSGLTSVTIPNSVTTIRLYAFCYCSGLTSITSYATTPPACGPKCFYGVRKYIPIYVPARSVNAYKSATEWKDFTNIQANPDYFGTVTCVAEHGTVSGSGKYTKGDTCTLTVTPDYGYHFIQWSDGNTDNPRVITITQDTMLMALSVKITNGSCGDNLIWSYGDGILVISGTGTMYDYAQGTSPWILFKDSIESLVINNGCTSIGNFAFYGLSNKNFKTLDIPNSVETIGQFAFANCAYLKTLYLGVSLEKISVSAFANDERLYYITCYAEEPPLLEESAFVNYDAYLSVPCESQAEYKVAKGWKKFNKENISCIGAEEQVVTKDEVAVSTSATEATLTWPADDQATGYSIEITKDGVVFCTLQFNANGQLTEIAFAPSRDGERTMPAAEMTAKGWQFTVTGLNEGTRYDYTVDVLDGSQQSMKHYTGAFTTTGGTPTGGEDILCPTTARKMIYQNQLLIYQNGGWYNAQGQILR